MTSRLHSAISGQLLNDRAQAALGVLLAAWLAVPALRLWLEASMWRHMLLQYPLWMLSGALLTAALPSGMRHTIARWNAHGISGLAYVGIALTVLMIPRVLDQALLHPGIEVAKCAALVLAGSLLRLSWIASGLVVQSFFLGNMLLMGTVVGQLYASTPLRLCNAYLLDDQERLGTWLSGISIGTALAWLAYVMWWLVQREAQTRTLTGAPAPTIAAAHAVPNHDNRAP